jgi:hypothetical protein
VTKAYVAHAGDAGRDRDLVLDLWRGNIGKEQRLEAKFDWFYLGCPWGVPVLQLLRHEPSAAWVGVAGAGPRRMFARDREASAGILVDLAVTEEHRSLGPALTLQKGLMAAARERFDLLYGFPNPRAAPVFQRAGYGKLGDIVRYARVLRHGEHLGRRIPRAAARPLGWTLDAASRVRAAFLAARSRALTASWHDALDPRTSELVDALWAESDHGVALIAPRTTAMLRWRFDRAPLPKVRYLLLREVDSGPLHAWFACERAGQMLHVRDFWSVDSARGIGARFIEAMLRAARHDGAATVSVEYAGPALRHAAWVRAGFAPRTRRPILGKWTRGAEMDLHLTSADEDE